MANHKIVFLGGLHRSGTTPLASCLAQHPAISGFSDTGAYADEGQHLQWTYSTAYTHGGPGSFALSTSAHLTEADAGAAATARRELDVAWQPHWDMTRPVLVEKSPPNLIRFRYLQSLFPEARCLAILRHPVAVAFATRRMRRKSLDHLLRHWLHAHTLLLNDAPFIRHLAVVHYESLVDNPQTALARVFRWLDINPGAVADELRDGNGPYFAAWRTLTSGWRRSQSNKLIARFEALVSRFGYSFLDLEQRPTEQAHVLQRWQLNAPLRLTD
jgi:hypothetical protein